MNSLKKKTRLIIENGQFKFRLGNFLGDFQNKIVNMDYHVFVSVSSVIEKENRTLKNTYNLYLICHWFYEICFLAAI